MNKQYTPERKKICIVSSCGGHLTEIRSLRSVYSRFEHFYVINEKIIIGGDMVGRIYFVRHSERDWLFFSNLAEAWVILRKEKPGLIMSTGAGVIVPFCIIGKLMGIPTIFIETLTRVYRPSLTGKIMHRLADRFFYQWETLKPFFPNGIYGGPLV